MIPLDKLTEADRLKVRKDLARRSFWGFRCMLRPKQKRGWWQKDAADRLQNWWERFRAGERPKLVIEAPPQHGKSELVGDFNAWLHGMDPSLAIIYASFSDRLGVRANLAQQRIHDSRNYRQLFAQSGIPSVRSSSGFNRNRELVELFKGGSFRNTTVDGSITGEGLDVGVIDDPIKGRAEANSQAVRDKVWDWLMDDFFTRFADHAGLLAILTRWHVDDPIGRLINQVEGVEVVSYPALASKGLELLPTDPRTPGSDEPLFPEHKSLEFLLERRRAMTEASWSSLYQQQPFVVGGGMFPVERFGYLDFPPDPRKVVQSVRYWDKAGTADGGDYTAGVLVHEMKDGTFVVEDVQRGQWEQATREAKIQSTAQSDGHGVVVWVEQEPGSGGKDSARATIRGLAGFSAYADKVTGDKELRAEPYAAQVQNGNVLLVRAPWNRAFVQEHETFPNGANDDQVDAAGGAFGKLVDSDNSAGVW